MFGRLSDDSSNSMSCNKSPDLFCFVCTNFILSKSKSYPLNDTNRSLYSNCFKVTAKHNGADKLYSSKVVCASCITNMKDHTRSDRPLKFSSPAIWNQPNHSFSSHHQSCYVCLAEKVQGSRFQVSYKWSDSARHNVVQPVLDVFNLESPCSSSKKVHYESESHSESEDDYSNCRPSNPNQFMPYDQSELNQLVKELGLTKDQSMVLASNLRKHNALKPDCRVGFYATRNHDLLAYFDEDNGVPYLKNIQGLFDWLNYDYVPDQWRLFMDSSKSAFKIVLLHNGNLLPSIPLLYSPSLKETYNDVQYALQLINYNSHRWKIIADLKLLNVLCGVGCPSVKNPCILCDWQGTYRSNKQYQQYHQNTQRRTDSVIGTKSIVADSLIDLNNVLLPPLHVKIGLIAQFIKKLGVNTPAYNFIADLLNHKSTAKLEAGQLDGPEIRKILKEENTQIFESYLSPPQLRAWNAFKDVCENFLGKKRSENYKAIARELVDSYEKMGCNMSYKLHIMDKHVDDFPPSCSDFSDEMGERFHQDIKKAEKIYQGRFDKFMLADYCWFLKQEAVSDARKGRRRSQFPLNKNM